MTVHRAEWDQLPPEPQRLAWVDWFTNFGIDARHVSVPGWVETDDTTRQIHYLTVVLDDDGKALLDHTACGHDQQIRRCDLARGVAVVQLEARALPFPVARQEAA